MAILSKHPTQSCISKFVVFFVLFVFWNVRFELNLQNKLTTCHVTTEFYVLTVLADSLYKTKNQWCARIWIERACLLLCFHLCVPLHSSVWIYIHMHILKILTLSHWADFLGLKKIRDWNWHINVFVHAVLQLLMLTAAVCWGSWGVSCSRSARGGTAYQTEPSKHCKSRISTNP